MGLWQNLCEAYTANEGALRKNYPLSTTSVSNAVSQLLIVAIDGIGTFKSVRVIPKRKKNEETQTFVIPVTEESLGRVGPNPHPLFDQYEYLKGDGAKFEQYLSCLSKRRNISREFAAVYHYVSKRTLASDIGSHLPEEDVRAVKDKTFVLFEIEFPGEPNSRLWENQVLMERWHGFYEDNRGDLARKEQALVDEVRGVEDELAQLEREKAQSKDKTRKKELLSQIKSKKTEKSQLGKELCVACEGPVFCEDMISGMRAVSAISHPKKIVNAAGNAKLISDNDKVNFTYRGRFANSHEAFSVSYDSSQRAHQFLRYIVNERGIKCDSQVIVSFTITKDSDKGASLPPPPVGERESLWGGFDTGSDASVNLAAETGFNFAQALSKALSGYKVDPVLKAKAHDPTMILILDAATTGRLSVTFYREMTREDYLEKLLDWHSTCQWQLVRSVKDKRDEQIKYVEYVGAPSIDAIISTVYGRPRGSDSGYNKLKKRARETLVKCIFDNSPFPGNYLIQAVRRASAPLANAVVNEKFNKRMFLQNVCVACALVNKSLKDEGKESYEMSIESERKDRDYLYGRLLGAADKLEEYALYKKSNKRQETAAVRYMQTFSQKPYSTWNTIHQTLVPYIQQVKGCFAFNEIQQIHDDFKRGDFENDAPLSGIYLLGYYCERIYIEQRVSEICNKKDNKTEESK